MYHIQSFSALRRLFSVFVFALLATVSGPPAAMAETSEQINEKKNSVPEAHGRTLTVECDKGHSINKALGKAVPGDTIIIRGTCHEQVTITTDRLTLDGEGDTIIDGQASVCDLGPFEETNTGQLEIDGAQGVVVTGIKIQGSPVDGIYVRNSAAVEIRDTHVRNSCDDGIQSDQSAVTLENSSFNENQESGINLFENSSLIVRVGSSQFNDNGRQGLQIWGSVASVDGGALLEARGNGLFGITALAQGQVIAFTGSRITVTKNGKNGFILINAGLTATYANIIVTDNGSNAEEDNSGITLVDAATSSFVGGKLTLEGNQPIGLLAESATMSMRLIDPPSAISIINNGLDVALRFGSRATLLGMIGSIVCDDTVLSQGTTQCPGAPVTQASPSLSSSKPFK
jgi:hypothetical protein